uniref:ARID domain-containing protein n=1 Tax=Strigamia maritima TaxID=126957 RepID=T1JB82_STRMM
MAKYQAKDSAPKHAHPTDNAFLTELRQFHESRGSPFRRTPSLNGRAVDLSLLYQQVTSLGGWRKVNDTQKWDTVLQKMNLPRSCANAALALKQFYIRYLDHYEKIHFLGEDPDDDGIESLDHPARRTQSLANLVPLSYNHHQHEVSENARNQFGLSTDFSSVSDYDKLILSLQSGFPNEVDFALNVCTLLSNEGRHTLRLQKNPRLIDLLVSHAGVWTESNMNLKSLLEKSWSNTKGRQMSRFWDEIIDDKKLREVYLIGQKNESPEEDELFVVGRNLGVRESEGQRILQIVTILWNLSFEEANAPIIASSPSCLKFLFLCVYTKWSSLQQLALETLGNISSDITLDPMDGLNTQVMFYTLAHSLLSRDRFLVIRALEILTGLCKVEGNEETIIKNLEQKMYEHICSLLTIYDIMILIYVLECLYHITDLGPDVCNSIVRIHRVVEVLINLITVEAQAYGPSACISMKVIETAPPVQPAVTVPINQRPQPAPPPTQRNAAPVSPIVVQGYQEADNDTFASNWLRAYYEWHSGSCISQNELYVNYQTTCNKLGKKGLVPPSQLINLLKNLYPQVKSRQEGIRSDVQLEGIRRRAVTLPVSIYMPTRSPAPSATTANQRNAKGLVSGLTSNNSPILKAQLSAPARTCSSTANSHPHLQQALLGRSQPSAMKPTAATPPSTPQRTQASKDSSTLIKSLLANKVSQNMLLKQQQQSSNGSSVIESASQVVDSDGALTVRTGTSPSATATRTTLVIARKETNTAGVLRPRSPKSRVNGATRNIQIDENRMFQVCTQVEHAKDLTETSEFHAARIERLDNHLRDGTKKRIEEDDDEPTLDKLLRGSSSIRSSTALQNGLSTQNGNRSEPDSPHFVTMEVSPPMGFNETAPVRRKGVLADLLEGKVHKDTLLTMNGIVDRSKNSDSGKEQVNSGSSSLVFATKSTVPRTNGESPAVSVKIPAMAVTPKTVKVILPVAADKGGASVKTATVLTDWSALPSASKVIVQNKSNDSEELIGFPRVSMEQLNQLRQQVKTTTVIAVKRVATDVSQSGHEAKRTRVDVVKTLPVKIVSSESSSPILSPSEVQQQVSAALQGSFTDQLPLPVSSTVVAVETTDEKNGPCTPDVKECKKVQSDQVVDPSKVVAIKSEPKKDDAKVDFVCEWKDCLKSFNSPMSVFVHACKTHVPENEATVPCLWESCDQMTRQRLSLMTHLQDRHCNDNMLRLQATRRQQLSQMGSSTIPPPAPPPPHPGYAPNAAVQAIRRHALEFMAQKELMGVEEKEGPVTKSIRLTAALTLRNLVTYSALAKNLVKRYESNLSIVAMSNVESSRTVAQCLWELNRPQDNNAVR